MVYGIQRKVVDMDWPPSEQADLGRGTESDLEHRFVQRLPEA